jgi:hypothetical protein
MEQRRQNPAAAFDVVALAVSERASARSLLEPLTEALANNRQWDDSSPLERESPLRQRLNARAAAQVSLLSRKRAPAQAAAKEMASFTAEYTQAKRQARIKEASTHYRPQAATSSRMLLGPAASRLGAKRLLLIAGMALQYILHGAATSPASNSLSANHNPQSTTLLSADSRARNRPFAFGFDSGGVDDGRASARPAALPQGYEGGIIHSGYS